MPSFDIVSKVDIQKLDNAINTATKEITTRYDFHGSKTEIELDKKTLNVHIVTENDMRMKAIEGVIIARMVKQGLEPACLDFGKELYAAGNMVKKDIKIKEGVDKEMGKKIVKVLKESGLKIQGSIMDDQVRVTGKKIDDLQDAIARVKQAGFEQPLQYINFRN
ncbi:MAG TPA: YajQ family cyclic di-GMP-binding protein [Bacteroidia bacterium]|nr:YajQ family cyclic di-GMP-binding protein [Bacteroidia bacterium]